MTGTGFDGRVAIVTGAGGGLGRAYALGLARCGVLVVVNDLGDAADAVVAEVEAAGGRAIASRDSVASRAGGAAIVQTALDAFGRLDILVANAGILRTARLGEIAEADVDAMLDVHLKAGFHVGQPAFPAMKRRGYGRILLTASSSGLFGHPWQAGYARAGLVGLASAIALEGAPHGILCNVILPSARTRMADEIDWAWAQEVPDVGAVLAELMAMKSGGGERLDPEWVVPLALHLVSERSDATHALFSACSGRYARVFIGAAPGWAAPQRPGVEQIGAHWDEICDLTGFTEPRSVYDEALAARCRIAQASQV